MDGTQSEKERSLGSGPTWREDQFDNRKAVKS